MAGERGEMYCAMRPSGTAATAASACAETGIGAVPGATVIRSPFRPMKALTYSMMRPVTASITRNGAT